MKNAIETFRKLHGCSINEAKQDFMIQLQLERHSKALLQQLIRNFEQANQDMDEDELYLFMMQVAEAYGVLHYPNENFKRDELTYLMTQQDQEFFWKFVEVRGRLSHS